MPVLRHAMMHKLSATTTLLSLVLLLLLPMSTFAYDRHMCKSCVLHQGCTYCRIPTEYVGGDLCWCPDDDEKLNFYAGRGRFSRSTCPDSYVGAKALSTRFDCTFASQDGEFLSGIVAVGTLLALWCCYGCVSSFWRHKCHVEGENLKNLSYDENDLFDPERIIGDGDSTRAGTVTSSDAATPLQAVLKPTLPPFVSTTTSTTAAAAAAAAATNVDAEAATSPNALLPPLPDLDHVDFVDERCYGSIRSYQEHNDVYPGGNDEEDSLKMIFDTSNVRSMIEDAVPTPTMSLSEPKVDVATVIVDHDDNTTQILTVPTWTSIPPLDNDDDNASVGTEVLSRHLSHYESLSSPTKPSWFTLSPGLALTATTARATPDGTIASSEDYSRVPARREQTNSVMTGASLAAAAVAATAASTIVPSTATTRASAAGSITTSTPSATQRSLRTKNGPGTSSVSTASAPLATTRDSAAASLATTLRSEVRLLSVGQDEEVAVPDMINMNTNTAPSIASAPSASFAETVANDDSSLRSPVGGESITGEPPIPPTVLPPNVAAATTGSNTTTSIVSVHDTKLSIQYTTSSPSLPALLLDNNDNTGPDASSPTTSRGRDGSHVDDDVEQTAIEIVTLV